jgi:hypothetical protein
MIQVSRARLLLCPHPGPNLPSRNRSTKVQGKRFLSRRTNAGRSLVINVLRSMADLEKLVGAPR